MPRFRRAVIAALPLLLSSTAWADLRTFDLDPRYQQEVLAALTDVLENRNPVQGSQTYGRVELLPSGQILVNASAETLQQVEQVLQTIRNRPAAPTPRAGLSYWAVLGSPATAANPPGAAPPASLNDVLGELRRVHGDLQFRVIGSAYLATESGQEGRVSGMALEVHQTVYIQGATLNAAIDMNLKGTVPTADLPTIGTQFDIGAVTVRTALSGGEFVVLGQSELVAGTGASRPVFFIVNWSETIIR